MSDDNLEADAYLVIEGRRAYGRNARVVKVVAVGVRQNPPALERDQVAVRVRVQVPRSVFDPAPTPETTIVLVDPRTATAAPGVTGSAATAIDWLPDPAAEEEPEGQAELGSGTDPQQWHR